MKPALILILFTNFLTAQVHFNVGFTDVADRHDGNTFTYSIGYSHVVENWGGRASYKKVSVRDLNYTAVDLMAVYRTEITGFRTTFGLGASWEDENKKTNPIISLENAFRVSPGLYVSLGLNHVRRKSPVTHLLVGVAINY